MDSRQSSGQRARKRHLSRYWFIFIRITVAASLAVVFAFQYTVQAPKGQGDDAEPAAVVTRELLDFDMRDLSHGWALYSDGLMQTDDGGAHWYVFKILLGAGIPVKINKHSGLMHLKMTIADRKAATTGSFNYSKAASTTNDEILMVIHDEDIATVFNDQFNQMWDNPNKFEDYMP